MLVSDIGDHELVVRGASGLYAVDVKQYPDGMPLMEAFETPFHRMLLRPKSLATFMAAMFWIDAIRDRGVMPYYIELLLPNVPGARQDRLNPTGDFLFTAKSIAREINARQFASVTVLDPHSDVIAGLIDRCKVEQPEFSVSGDDYAGVIAPDGGAAKRALHIAMASKLPLYHGWKSRDIATGRISGFGVQPLPPGHYLIVDDLCDAGGTFLGLAEVLFRFDATADLYVTHGLFTKGTEPLLKMYRRVFCTDSVTGDKPGVRVIPRCALLLGGTTG